MNNSHFYQYFNGQVKRLSGKGLTKTLIKRANECIQESLYYDYSETNYDQKLRLISYNILHKFFEEGSSKEFLSNYNVYSQNIKFKHIFIFDKAGIRPKMIEVLDMEEFRSPYEDVLYTFLCAYKSDNLNSIKRCRNENCTEFFSGKSNKLSCSKRCSDIFRGRKKRRKDKRK